MGARGEWTAASRCVLDVWCVDRFVLFSKSAQWAPKRLAKAAGQTQIVHRPGGVIECRHPRAAKLELVPLLRPDHLQLRLETLECQEIVVAIIADGEQTTSVGEALRRAS